MDGAVAETEKMHRFFCHKCRAQFEDEDDKRQTCPNCETGFIEIIENYNSPSGSLKIESSDAELSDIDESGESSAQDESSEGSNAHFDELASSTNEAQRSERQSGREMLVDQLVRLTEAGQRRFNPVSPRAGPLNLVGTPTRNYFFAREGFDSIITHLDQLENTGPPPLPEEQISMIPSELITAAQVEANLACPVCWDAFTLDESVSRLECAHFYHQACINPWLQQHATCPICRHSLLPPEPSSPTFTESPPLFYRVIRERFRFGRPTESSSSSSVTSMGGLWAHNASFTSPPAHGDTPSQNSSDSSRIMDTDFD